MAPWPEFDRKKGWGDGRFSLRLHVLRIYSTRHDCFMGIKVAAPR
jgi:hypothetical protein